MSINPDEYQNGLRCMGFFGVLYGHGGGQNKNARIMEMTRDLNLIL
jgi:hypothetical protein